MSDHSHPDFRCLRHGNGVYHDVFISYRVNTEKRLADKLALLLDGYEKDNGQRVRTFLDSNCLLDGGDWEKNFLSALHHTTLLILLISEAGLDLRPAPGEPTKIQAADKTQDNCLLEYEYALELKERGLVDILVLCVAKDDELGEDGNREKCRTKFPSSPAEIEKRLLMYSDTKEHNHRDGSKGPRVPDTMRKLLNFVSPKKSGSPATFLHIDPDDAASRIPDILSRLRLADHKTNTWSTIRREWHDLAFLKQQVFGFFVGMVFPIFSLLFTMTSRTVRHHAIRFGIFLGNAFDLIFIAALLLYKSFEDLPKYCASHVLCEHQYFDNLAYKYPKYVERCLNGTLFDCSLALEEHIDDRDCADCFCNKYLYYCEDQDDDQKAYLFLGLLVLFVGLAVFAVAFYLKQRSHSRKARSRV